MTQQFNFTDGIAATYMNKDLLYPPQELETNIEMVFEHLFKSHFKALHAYAFTILKEEMMAEEIVQNVFCRLWEKREQIEINQSAKAYLYRSVYNESLNYLKHQKVKVTYQKHAARNEDMETHSAAKTEYKELQFHLANALNELPEQCRTIFQMSRFEELKYREIASELGLSVKTVENQMGKALKILRTKLVDFLPAILLSFLNL